MLQVLPCTRKPCWETFRVGQDRAVEEVFEQFKAMPGTMDLVLCRRWDTSPTFVQLSADQQTVVMRWLLEKVRNSGRWLSDADKDVLCRGLTVRHGATVKLCAQRNHLSWGMDANHQEAVIVAPCVVQNGNASNSLEMLRKTCPAISVERVIKEMSPYARIMIIALMSDQGADVERAKRELALVADPYPNCLVAIGHCLAHQLGIGARESCMIGGTLSKIFQIVGTLREQEQERLWMASTAVALVPSLDITVASQVIP